VRAASLILAVALCLAPRAAAAAPPEPTTRESTAFLTYEGGVLVGVNWVERQGNQLHTRSVLMQSRVLDATITLRDDETAVASSTTLQEAGRPPGEPIARSFQDNFVAWSDMIPSSIEQAVRRARLVGRSPVKLPASSLFRDSKDEAEVARVDSTGWTVRCHGKTYRVLTDADGRMQSASLPECAVVIERRDGFPASRYPLWAPNAAPPDSAYRAVNISIRAPQGHLLAGTLTLPRGGGPHPAAVLITGLSASNRNGGDPPWMPLRDVADALTRHGIAVLRVDDRGVGESTGNRDSSTTFDEADDVRTEVAWLRKQTGIRKDRIALVGYSEGGLIAPMVASSDAGAAAIVTLAGPGVSGAEVARYQTEAMVVRDSSIAPANREAEIAKLLADTLTIREKSYLGIDPLAYARKVRCPALIVQGANDLHVPPRSAERLAGAMRSAGNKDVTVRLFPGVSHSLLPDPVGLNSGWVYLPGFMTSPEILRTMSDWLATRLSLATAPPGGSRHGS
jgi:pimeloyl-ACP methyl ester carboxylesterase